MPEDCVSINTAQCSTDCQQKMNSILSNANRHLNAWCACAYRVLDLESRTFASRYEFNYPAFWHPTYTQVHDDLYRLIA